MKRVPIRSTLVAVVMLSMLVISITVSAQGQPSSKEKASAPWLTYVDPRFDFSIRYPSDWEAIPRDDNPNAVSEILVFAPAIAPNSNIDAGADPHEPGPHVIVVPYMAELRDGQSLDAWTEMYELLGPESERVTISRQPRKVYRVNGARAVQEEGISPLTTYQFTNIAHHNMVWDIWTNIPSTDPLASVYDRMVRSFRFGRTSPANLREAYGDDFVPMDMEQVMRINTEAQFMDLQGVVGDEQFGITPGTMSLTSTWKAPVRKLHNGGVQWDVRCGSQDHDDIFTAASMAVDIYMPKYTPVYNAKIGTVTFAAFKNDGYGNLITIQAQGGKVAYYAHLNSISSMTKVGSLISTYVYIGASGNTSTNPPPTSYPYHLHFHVQWYTYPNQTPEDLRGMEGFTASTYPVAKPHNGVITICGKMGL